MDLEGAKAALKGADLKQRKNEYVDTILSAVLELISFSHTKDIPLLFTFTKTKGMLNIRYVNCPLS
jgi:hypothetical protein